MTEIQLLELNELVVNLNTEVDEIMPRGPQELQPPLAELLMPDLVRLDANITNLELTASDKEQLNITLQGELERVTEAHAAVEASLAEEVKERQRIESDAADVADSLLEADRTIDTLNADLEEAKARGRPERGRDSSEEVGGEQAAAVTEYSAALDGLSGLRRVEAVAAQATIRDLADGLNQLCDQLLVAPSPSPLLYGGSFASISQLSATTIGEEEDSTNRRASLLSNADPNASTGGRSWRTAARRAWGAIERLEGGGLINVSRKHDAALLAMEVRNAESQADAWKDAYTKQDEALVGLMEEMRHQKSLHENTQEQAVKHLTMQLKERDAAEKCVVREIKATEGEVEAASAVIEDLREELREQIVKSMELVEGQHQQVVENQQLKATERELQRRLESSYQRSQQLQSALAEKDVDIQKEKSLMAKEILASRETLRTLQNELAEMDAATQSAKKEHSKAVSSAEAGAMDLQTKIEEGEDRLEALREEYAVVCAQAEERSRMLDAERSSSASKEVVYELQLQLVKSAVKESEGEVTALASSLDTTEEELRDANEQLKEIPLLEDQLSKAELHGVAMQLELCLSNAWLTSIADGLRRWVYFAVKAYEGCGDALWRRTRAAGKVHTGGRSAVITAAARVPLAPSMAPPPAYTPAATEPSHPPAAASPELLPKRSGNSVSPPSAAPIGGGSAVSPLARHAQMQLVEAQKQLAASREAAASSATPTLRVT